MYFNDRNNFFHGIMFHHFHDNKMHIKSQGSISRDDFFAIINFIGRDNILDADVFFEKFKSKKLKEKDLCITFDDASKSQIDVALPVLEELRIKSFFFAYTSMFEGKPDNLEIFRFFRTNYFNNVDDFYISFYKVLDENFQSFFQENYSKIKYMVDNFPFYTLQDIKFRLVRDNFLTKTRYEKIMSLIMAEKKFIPEEFYSKLFFDKTDLKRLDELGHLVGLHSHSHPTLIEKLNFDEQKNEYKKCKLIISKILNKSESEIKYMSHPCGSYNTNTLMALKDLDVQLGFRQTMGIEKEKGMLKINNSHLEIARKDHADIFNLMNK